MIGQLFMALGAIAALIILALLATAVIEMIVMHIGRSD